MADNNDYDTCSSDSDMANFSPGTKNNPIFNTASPSLSETSDESGISSLDSNDLKVTLTFYFLL